MKKDEAYLKHILDAVAAIETYTQDVSKEEFVNKENKMMQDAVVREFEIIGEAVGRLSEEIKKENSDLPWRDIGNMRNKLIHEYFGVDLAVVWKTVETDLLVLKQAINKIMEAMAKT
ncbi:MAG: DUF86 domain-containing protein [Candidatus Yanofskybacteria bacterium]|nr:DUF86 domain-containing protein [Candidatus Yanofskybacteria bacterium]